MSVKACQNAYKRGVTLGDGISYGVDADRCGEGETRELAEVDLQRIIRGFCYGDDVKVCKTVGTVRYTGVKPSCFPNLWNRIFS